MGYTDFQRTIKTLPDYEVYFIIEEFGTLIAKLDAAIRCKMVVLTNKIQKQIEDADYMINLAVQETRRFGVDDLLVVNNEVVDSSPKYRQWYRFWKRWRFDIPEETWKAFVQARTNKQDLSQWLPKNSWQDDETDGTPASAEKEPENGDTV